MEKEICLIVSRGNGDNVKSLGGCNIVDKSWFPPKKLKSIRPNVLMSSMLFYYSFPSIHRRICSIVGSRRSVDPSGIPPKLIWIWSQGFADDVVDRSD